MRVRILQILRENAGDYISGEEVSRRLAVSRTAIWKHIQALKQDGYDIEAHSRSGYRLCGTPDLLLPEEICLRLDTEVFGRQIHYLSAVTSTNTEAKRLATDGCPEGLIVVAEEQTGGRGRLARGWYSPRGKGIWLSLVLRPPFSPQEAPKCTLLAAVAVNKAIRRVTNVASGIKWPNDILYEDKKLVGILTEMTAEMDAINYVVIGMGINVNIAAEEFPAELAASATSLLVAGGRRFSRLELTAAVLEEFEAAYHAVIRDGFEPLLAEWRAESVTLGRTVDVLGVGRQFSGVAVDIAADGALLIETESGLERVVAGDVSIRARVRGE
ncbi:MAG: biotin--[acetyl-CoA-carboxylase] ligase [Negativicutes bacterium]|nr:biotin--[acetyl-CoA-carboxylase] ligase [Negativicutes bacterium]